jgi:hypothetical protein
MLKRLWIGWRAAAKKIGYFQSQAVLTLMYFTAMAPFAIAVRVFTDPLRLREAPLWRSLPPGAQAHVLDSVRQQF